MAYTVLARKYRSRTFDEVVGQQPIATTLVNAINADRIHHGYLFTGTRGVGKTSMARILAKALNCLTADGPTPTPCLTCDACTAIAEGGDIDVVEIDAASNTGVDNVRELRSNAAYRPARSRFKIYIIDEVHMLSTGAFNALLKTLEEPPGHVKFILATTEIQKVPATIQSRCQRFNFQNIGPSAIADRLTEIVANENAAADPAVLQRVARLANGSMRDALSILDQLLSVATERLTLDILTDVLPPSQDEQVVELFTHAANGDAAAVLTTVENMLAAGRAPELICNDAAETARALMHLSACGPDAPLVDVPAGDRDAFVQLSQQFTLSQYVQIIGLLEELRRNVRYSSASRALLDAGLVRLAKLREWSSVEELLSTLASPAGAEKKKPAPLIPDRNPATSRAAESPPPRNPAPPPAPPPARPTQAQSETPGPNGRPTPDPSPEPPKTKPAEPAPPGTSALDNLTQAEKDAIRTDPVVQQVLELFDGQIVHMHRRPPSDANPDNPDNPEGSDNPETE